MELLPLVRIMPQTAEEGLRIAEEIKKEKTTGDRHENALQRLRLVSGGNGSMVCEMMVENRDRNAHGTLHGGMMCTLSDAVSTWALHTIEPKLSASIDLHISFMKPARVERTILIEAKTVKKGRRMVFLSVDIRDKEEGYLIAQARQTKLILEKGSQL